MTAILQWLVLSACILAIYFRAYGHKAGLVPAVLFIGCIALFVWLLNRGDKNGGKRS